MLRYRVAKDQLVGAPPYAVRSMTDYEIARLQLARRWWMHSVRSQPSYAIVPAGADAALRASRHDARRLHRYRVAREIGSNDQCATGEAMSIAGNEEPQKHHEPERPIRPGSKRSVPTHWLDWANHM